MPAPDLSKLRAAVKATPLPAEKVARILRLLRDAPDRPTRSCVIRLRVTEAEHMTITASAEAAGMTVSQWLRRAANKAAEEETR